MNLLDKRTALTRLYAFRLRRQYAPNGVDDVEYNIL